MKIGIAGTHSTGKTTILEFVAQKLQASGISTARVSDLASAARDAGFPILRQHTFSSTLWIMSRGICEELAAALKCDVVLVDRPVPDALGYLYAALEHRGECLPDADIAYLRSLSRMHAKTYDLLFRTQPNPTLGISTDKERDLDLDFRGLSAAGIDRVFTELDLSSTVLPYDTSQGCELVLSQILGQVRCTGAKGRDR